MEDSRSVEQHLDCIDRLIADFKIEGIEFTPKELGDFRQMALGKKTGNEIVNELFAKVERLRVTNPELFI